MPKRELGDLVDVIPEFEQPADRLMAQIVKSQILNSKDAAGTGERIANAFRVVWENVPGVLGLSMHDVPTLGCVFEPQVIAEFLTRMLRIANES